MVCEHTCPYCSEELVTWDPPDEAGWDHALMICQNNECSYFVRGRSKVCKEYERNFSYRYCYDPATGKELPILAWCGGDLSLLKGRCKEACEV